MEVSTHRSAGNRKLFVGLAAVLILASRSVSGFTVGDTWTADLSGKTLPPGATGLTKGKGTGIFTLTAAVNNEYYWEVDVYDITELSSIDLVLATSPDLPVVLTLTTTYLPDELVYFGNFTTDYLHGQLEARGYDESALTSDNLYAIVREVSPPGAAIAGLVTANAIADFNDTAEAPSSGEDFGDAVTSDVVYVAQLQNSTVPLFRSGMTEMPGTGSMIIQDMLDGTFAWTMDTENLVSPRTLQLRYFATLEDQPLLFNLTPTPRFNTSEESYEGNFTLSELNTALATVGAPPSTTFNTTPPVLFAALHDRKNGSIVGFVFDANAAPTLPPVVKGAAPSMRPGAAPYVAALLALLFAVV